MRSWLKAIFEGIGSLFDLSGRGLYRPRTCSPQEADARALRSDWEAVGADLERALNEFAEEHDLPL
jgi:hypothetical protein